MASSAQINANRQNAQSSTGPVTQAGKATSSRNHTIHGLYTRQDYVALDERELYKEFCDTMYVELCPESLLEESFVQEITSATWRLRRCNVAEGSLSDYLDKDPLLDPAGTKTIRSIERARASAHSVLNRSINQLRKIQTERTIRFELSGTEMKGLIDFKQVDAAHRKQQRSEDCGSDNSHNQEINLTIPQIIKLCEPPPEFTAIVDKALADYTAKQEKQSTESASNCEPARNAPCPCGSGKKFKQCCRKTGPGWEIISHEKAA